MPLYQLAPVVLNLNISFKLALSLSGKITFTILTTVVFFLIKKRHIKKSRDKLLKITAHQKTLEEKERNHA